MMVRRFGIASLFVAAACSGDGSTTPAAAAPASAFVSKESSATAGDSGQLASELLLASGGQPTSLQSAAPVSGSVLSAQLAQAALDHVRSELGNGAGPTIEGSERIRRLAADPTAPPDANANQSNWDETLAAEYARIESYSAATLDPGIVPSLFPFKQGSAELAGPLGGGQNPPVASWRTRSGGDTSVRLVDIGSAMRARALVAGRLLQTGRGALAGATPDAGALGLLCTEQLIDADETLIGALFTDGRILNGLPNAASYDPQKGARWLPAEFAAVMDPNRPGVVTGYRMRDSASDLAGLAAVLDASAELYWLARDQQPAAPVRSVFRGAPFEAPDLGKPSGPTPLNYDDDIGPLLMFRCGGCHYGYPEGGWQMDTLQMVLAGSPHSRAAGRPMVVAGNHAQSLLWTIVTVPPPGFQRMPWFSAPMAATEAQMIADWIDQGALESAPTQTPPQRGLDLALAQFRNLVALHWDAQSGGLHHRHDSDGSSGIATSISTGRALQALAHLRVVLPDAVQQQHTVDDVLGAAARFAAAHLLLGSGQAIDSVPLDGAAGLPPVAQGAGIDAQAALTAGLLAARAALPQDTVIAAAAQSALSQLLSWFDATTGTFGGGPGYRGARLSASTLADLLASLRLGIAFDGRSRAIRDQFLARIRTSLVQAEWAGNGEVLGDGIADTDGNGIPEPMLADGRTGRLPVLSPGLWIGAAAQQPPASDEVSWTQHVRPLLLAKCGECHANGSQQGDYALDTVTMASTPGESGGRWPMIVPGNPESSFLYRKLVDRLPARGQQMPLSGTLLDDRSLAQVRNWILQGASRR
jgi:hypothetical protein